MGDAYNGRRPYQNGNGNGGGSNGPQPLIGRVPPQNLEAEMAVLGAMVLGDRGAIEKATEILTRDDFYRDAHAHLYDAMVTLTEKDEPVDAVTLRNELTRQGILEQIGGVAYIVQLADVEFTTANIAYYARIVAEKAILRRLIDAASQIAGLAYGEVEEVGTLVDKAERTIFEVARRRDNQSFAPLRPLLNEAFDKISDTYHEKGMVSGVDTGFDQLNYITSGLQDGDLVIIAARPSMGKCLTAGSLIDNPLTGERVTLETYVKEQLPLVPSLSEHGCVRPAQISHWIDSGVKPVWRVTTRTGRTVEVTGHHPFLTVHGWTPLHDLHVGNKIGVARRIPVFGNDTSLSMDEVRQMGRDLAAVNAPFPACVWKWDKARLKEFLQALSWAGSGDFATASETMARDVQHAFVRIGSIRSVVYEQERWLVAVPVLLAPRGPDSGSDVYWDEITEIEAIGEQQVYDLTVPDGANFIANDICVHNTSLCLGIGQNAALRTGKSVAVFSLEMSKEQLVQRMICSEARIDAHRLRTGYLDDSDWGKISEAVNRLWDANLFIDDSNDLSSLEMRAKCRRLRAEHGLDLVIVDYLQLMRGGGRSDANRNEEITQIARGLKGLARELKVPVIALSQLSRAVERREDKRPMLSDLRECVTGDTRLYCADTGRLVPIADIKPGDRVLAVDKNHKTVAATVSQWWHKGVRPVFRVTTETGRVLETTANHPFLTDTGYKPLCEIATDNTVAVVHGIDGWGDIWGGAKQRDIGQSDVLWEKVRSVEPAGDKDVYDICVPETGCFLAEGVVVHNSGAIEAEADVVGFIYRPAYYERKEAISENADAELQSGKRAGEYDNEEAEIIIAKQRNGPTGTVKLAFMPKFARFDNLEMGREESPF